MAMNKTGIEYIDYTWNATHGCSPVSIGCQNCWAKTTANRMAHMGQRGYSIDDPFKVVCCDWKLDEPEKVRKPSRVGVSFMGDLFHKDVPFEFIWRIWTRMGACSQHDFLMLTKRPDRMREFVEKYCPIVTPAHWIIPIKNIWLGVSVEGPDQLWRIDELLKIKAAVRFVSFEPLLGSVELMTIPDGGWPQTDVLHGTTGSDCQIDVAPKIDWCIVGAESGSKRRECKIEHVRNIVEQCRDANVPCFVKQLHINGKVSKNMAEWPEDLRVQEYPA